MIIVYGFIILTAFISFLYIKSRKRYLHHPSMLINENNKFKQALPLGLYILEVVRYSYQTAYDQKIENRLKELYGIKSARSRLQSLLSKKICIILFGAMILLFFGSIQVIDGWIQTNERKYNINIIGNQITRPAFGEGNTTVPITAIVKGASISGQDSYNLSIFELPPSDDQGAVDMAWNRLSFNLIKGKNLGIHQIESDLTLRETYLGLGNTNVNLKWTTSSPEIISKEGVVQRPKSSEMIGLVSLTAHISKGKVTRLKVFDLQVLPELPLNESQMVEAALMKIKSALIKINNQEGLESPQISLPLIQEQNMTTQWLVGGENEIFQTGKQWPNTLLLLLAMASLVMYTIDNDIKTKISKRRRTLQYELPDFINKLILLINSGMTVSQAIRKILKHNQKSSPLYDELMIVMLDIQGGRTEQQSLEAFAERCHISEATKFVSVVLQNIRKGNAELVMVLRLQSHEFWEIRKNIARQLGEEASTKLLFPMLVILLVVLLIVLTPAVMALRGF